MICDVPLAAWELGDARPAPRRWCDWRVAVASAVLAIAAVVTLLSYTYYLVFRRMQCYDDEGYMLIQIQHFFRGSPLYDDIVTFYSPMYFLSATAGFYFLPFGHDGI
jgi:hypothetical protein